MEEQQAKTTPLNGPTLDIVAEYLTDLIQKRGGVSMGKGNSSSAQPREEATDGSQETRKNTREDPGVNEKYSGVETVKKDVVEKSPKGAQKNTDIGPGQTGPIQAPTGQEFRELDLGLMRIGSESKGELADNTRGLVLEAQVKEQKGGKEIEEGLGYTVEFPSEEEELRQQQGKALPHTTENLLAIGIKKLLNLKRTRTEELEGEEVTESQGIGGWNKKARQQLMLEGTMQKDIVQGIDRLKAEEASQSMPPQGP